MTLSPYPRASVFSSRAVLPVVSNRAFVAAWRARRSTFGSTVRPVRAN